MINHYDFYDEKIDRKPPYTGQPHTDTGERGKQVVYGVVMSDLYQAVSVALKNSCMNAKEFNALSIDPEAVAQNFCCEVEKLMGIYPNTEGLCHKPSQLDRLLFKEAYFRAINDDSC